MKIGIVSDIHCNTYGLEEALRQMGDIDELLCPGDILLEYRFSNEVLAILKERETRVVLGNHDIQYLTRLADKDSQKKINDDQLVDWLRSQPERLEIDPNGKHLLMVHATPWSWDYVFPSSPEMKRYAEVDADIVLGGHTHALFAERIGTTLVVNPGSAGQSTFKPNGPVLSCAVLDTQSEEVQLIEYSDNPADAKPIAAE